MRLPAWGEKWSSISEYKGKKDRSLTASPEDHRGALHPVISWKGHKWGESREKLCLFTQVRTGEPVDIASLKLQGPISMPDTQADMSKGTHTQKRLTVISILTILFRPKTTRWICKKKKMGYGLNWSFISEMKFCTSLTHPAHGCHW